MSYSTRSSRRSFLRTALALGGAGPGARALGLPLAGLGALAAQSSAAADVSGGYKALVCLFMYGGNDSHNWLVPTDATGYADYARARGELALPADRLQPIAVSGQAAGRTFGMPQELAPLRKWYQSGQAAFVANVGPLSRPITKTEFQSGIGVPSKLFSHNDQSSTWQSLQPEGAPSGWGGRMGDILASANAYPVFTAVSATSNAVFLTGQQVTQYRVGLEGPLQVNNLGAPTIFGSTAAAAALRRNIASSGTNPLQSEYARVMQRSVDTGSLLGTALAGVPAQPIPATPVQLGTTSTTLDKTPLARQLAIVARMISAGQALGMRRQVFMVSLSGFDTHSNQLRDQPGLMAQVALATDYFLTTIAGMNMLPNVTLFSASDFGRTLLSNGDGSDHGWGSHHFVAGGAVAGGNIHGRFPLTALGTSDDVGSGRLLPTYSVAQMAAPMGRWLGLSDAELAMALPTIGNFDSRALRFM